MRDAPLSPGRGLWVTALLVAALLHLALAALAVWSTASKTEGQAKASGASGTEISLGPASSAAGGPEGSQREGQPEQPDKRPEPDVPEPAPEPAPKTESESEPEPEPEPKPEPEPEPEPATEPEPVHTQEAKTANEPVSESESESVPQEAPEPKSIPEPVTRKQAEPVEPKSSEEAPPTQSNAGVGGKDGTEKQNNSGSGDNTAGGGVSGDQRDYTATLLARLQQHREYPRRARARGQEGTVMLYFRVDRQGRVLGYQIRQSSGHRALDDEVESMIQRAQPLPPMPDSMAKDTMELVVPVQFLLR